MILPTKYVSPGRSLLGVGGHLLARLERPRTVPALWDAVRTVPEIGTFERFALALDLLYTMGAVVLEDGLLRRRRPEPATASEVAELVAALESPPRVAG